MTIALKNSFQEDTLFSLLCIVRQLYDHLNSFLASKLITFSWHTHSHKQNTLTNADHIDYKPLSEAHDQPFYIKWASYIRNILNQWD